MSPVCQGSEMKEPPLTGTFEQRRIVRLYLREYEVSELAEALPEIAPLRRAEAASEVVALWRSENVQEPQASQYTEAYLEAEASLVAGCCLRAAGSD